VTSFDGLPMHFGQFHGWRSARCKFWLYKGQNWLLFRKNFIVINISNHIPSVLNRNLYSESVSGFTNDINQGSWIKIDRDQDGNWIHSLFKKVSKNKFQERN
jgi:hypothetical protein